MKFFRNNWYWIFSIVIGLGIGSIITMHRVQQQTGEPEHISPDVAEQTPDADKPQMRTVPDSTSRRTPNADVLSKSVPRPNPIWNNPVRPKLAPLNNPALKNIGSIPAAVHNDIIEPHRHCQLISKRAFTICIEKWRLQGWCGKYEMAENS